MIKLYETIKMNPAISPLAVTVKLLFRAAVAILTLGIAVSSEAQEYTGDGAERDSKPKGLMRVAVAQTKNRTLDFRLTPQEVRS